MRVTGGSIFDERGLDPSWWCTFEHPFKERRWHLRRVIVQELMTVDGFVADSSGGLEFFDVVSDYSESDRDNLSMLGEVDTVLLGSETYRLFVEYWPTDAAEGELVAEVVNSIPKIVFSSTLDGAPWGRWQPARVLEGSAADHVNRLRREPGKDLLVWGSISLAQSLIAAGLVDELQLVVVPTVIGYGRSLFEEEASGHALTLSEAKPYASGIVLLRYALARS